MGKKSKGDTPDINLEEMTIEQLTELAEEKGIDINPEWDKVGFIEALIEVDPTLAPSEIDEKETAETPDDPVAETSAEIDDYEIGQIRTIGGVEKVKISATEWVPTIREVREEGKPVRIVSKKRAGQTIFARSGKPITFDENGKAIVNVVDAEYLESVVIDDVPEFTVEG